MEIPSLIKDSMVAMFGEAVINKVDMINILIGSGVSEENAPLVMSVQFCTPFPGTFNTNSRSEHFEVFQIW